MMCCVGLGVECGVRLWIGLWWWDLYLEFDDFIDLLKVEGLEYDEFVNLVDEFWVVFFLCIFYDVWFYDLVGFFFGIVCVSVCCYFCDFFSFDVGCYYYDCVGEVDDLVFWICEFFVV